MLYRGEKCESVFRFEECMANTELIAFKLLRSIRGHNCHLVQTSGMPEYMTTREIRTMKYLDHMLMEEFLKPRLGSQLQLFSMESIQFQGFGLECTIAFNHTGL